MVVTEEHYIKAKKQLKVDTMKTQKVYVNNSNANSHNSLLANNCSILNNNGKISNIYLYTFMNQSYKYKGTFNTINQPHGNGKLYTVNDDLLIFEGTFIDGLINGLSILHDYLMFTEIGYQKGFMVENDYKGKV